MKLLAFPYRVGSVYVPDYCKSPEAMKTWLDTYRPKAKSVLINGVKTFVRRVALNKTVVFVPEGDTILYSMELFKMSVAMNSQLPPTLVKRSNFQGSVWRSPKLLVLSEEFAATLFTKFLVSKTRNVISDNSQSNAGEAFWLRRIASALKDPQFQVYGLDCEQVGNVLKIEKAEVISDLKQVDAYYTEGQDYSGYYKRLAIVKT